MCLCVCCDIAFLSWLSVVFLLLPSHCFVDLRVHVCTDLRSVVFTRVLLWRKRKLFCHPEIFVSPVCLVTDKCFCTRATEPVRSAHCGATKNALCACCSWGFVVGPCISHGVSCDEQRLVCSQNTKEEKRNSLSCPKLFADLLQKWYRCPIMHALWSSVSFYLQFKVSEILPPNIFEISRNTIWNILSKAYVCPAFHWKEKFWIVRVTCGF